MGSRLGLTVPPNMCGPGLFIVHWGSVVINGKAEIGSHRRIHSCVNIRESGAGAPVIGDNVQIGANAVVTKSFPEGVTVAGVPAKVIRKSETDANV